MESSTWEHVKDLFHRALDLSPVERASFLKDACNGDEQLRGKVEGLLAAHDDAGDFIVNPVLVEAGLVGSGDDETVPIEITAVPARVGQYEIIRELGRGGMGAVFLAHRADAQFEKQVAIKIVKRGMDTESILRRFMMERQILANLEHPNIARFLDGGTTEEGLPYFVMEYVEGEPITRYCDSKRLNTLERLDLFLQVCAAIQHAHQNLIVHRDIKPSNILVGADGTPKLLDFGIAKLFTSDWGQLESDQTATVFRLMTPEYASPEQLRGLPITTSSDVYSLGVVFYELLSGQPPFRFRSRMPDEIARILLAEEPLKPSSAVTLSDARETIPVENVDTPRESDRDTRSKSGYDSAMPACNPKSLKGDLDNIALKALRKDPDRRYASVHEFSADIRRHLRGLPVSARPDTFGYRAGKFVRRHKAGAFAAVVAVLALVSGTSVALWEAHVARAERDLAQTRFNQVRKLANSIVFEYHDQIRDLPGSTPVREKMIRDAIEYLDNLSAQSQNDPSLQRELAAAYEKVGDVQGNPFFENLGDEPGALDSYRKALEIRQELYKKNSRDPERKFELGIGHKNMGDILWSSGRNDEALSNYESALTIFTDLTTEEPDNLKYRQRVAGALSGIGHVQEQIGDSHSALESYGKALNNQRELLAIAPANDDYRRGVAICYVKVGDTQSNTGDYLTALESYKKAAEIHAERVESRKDSASALRELALAYGRLGLLYETLKQHDQSISYFKKSIELQNGIAASDPQNTQIRFDMGTSYQNLGDVYRGLRKLDPAATNVLHAINIFLDALKNDAGAVQPRSHLGSAYQTLGEIESARGNKQTASEYFKKALDILESEPVREASSEFLASCYEDVGDLQSSKHDWKAAIESYQKSRSLFLDLERLGRLTAGARMLPTELTQKIAKCQASLPK